MRNYPRLVLCERIRANHLRPGCSVETLLGTIALAVGCEFAPPTSRSDWLVCQPSCTDRRALRLDRQDRYRSHRSKGTVVAASRCSFGCNSRGRLLGGQAVDCVDVGRNRSKLYLSRIIPESTRLTNPSPRQICKGSVNRWKELLPKIRNLVTLLQRSRPDERYSDTQISLALNCIYHDVSWSVACKDDPQVPVETYGVFIRRAGSKPDMYLGICAPIYQVSWQKGLRWSEKCTQPPMLQVLSYIAALGARATSVHLVEDADDRFEHISRIIEEARGLGHRIDLLEVSSRTLSEMAAWQKDEESFNPQPLISTFQAFKSAAHAYLRQIVYRTPAIALEAQLSVARMLTTISTVLNTPSQSQILFPLFIAGVDAIREEDRNTVRSIFEKLHTITGTGNIQHIFTLLLSVWKVNDKGTTWVDWRQIASDVSLKCYLVQFRLSVC